ncbi:MAG: septal ring lytic transglycosylase RlpA family protein [Leptolyngbyaceae bacterium]|nr:septal ring lytic transglycosylase RlpA family protein [Leptolyngbyaceae bacterium]
MSQTLLRNSLVATLAIASWGIAMPAQANIAGQSDPQFDGNVPTDAIVEPNRLAQNTRLGSEQNRLSRSQSAAAKVGSHQITADDQRDEAIATIYAHELDGRPAATVYVRNIPTFTFLGEDTTEDENATAALPAQADAIIASGEDLDIADPSVRAAVLAAQINQYHLDGRSADDITVRWDADTEQLLLEAGSAWFLSMDGTVIFPETTGILAQDALYSTNLLRRQLGQADALTEVADLPLPSQPVTPVARASFSGMASWYGPGFHGRMSASGERFNQNAMTAAHRTLPFGTLVRVTNLNNGESTVVRINDRGPYSHSRVIDLSTAAAQSIGMVASGVAPVSVEVLN